MASPEIDYRDKILGSLMCGAYGDALGYPIEFMSDTEIISRFGRDGLTEPILRVGKMRFSDDTQMTLLAANSLIYRHTRWSYRGIAALPHEMSYGAYRSWALMMNGQPEKVPYAGECMWILKIPEITKHRAPGMTCMNQLLFHEEGATIEDRHNDSKGCGGVMRVAPYGLHMDLKYAIEFAVLDAASTHGHELGWLTAGLFAGIINQVMRDEPLSDSINTTISQMSEEYGRYDHWDELVQLMQRVISESDESRLSGSIDIRRFGEGWVAEEALAMALYSCLVHGDDVKSVLYTAVNHGGDSDSVGSIAGNIIGAMYGYDAISKQIDFSNLECKEMIERLAEDLYTKYERSDEWNYVYIYGNIPPSMEPLLPPGFLLDHNVPCRYDYLLGKKEE